MSEIEDQEFIPKVDGNVDPAEVVKFTQRLRYQIVDNLTNQGTYIPNDPKELAMVLKDMDQSALTQRKLNIEEQGSNNGRQSLEAYQQLRAMLGSKPFFVEGGPRRDPTAGLELPPVTLVPGEDAQGERVLNIDDYVSPET